MENAVIRKDPRVQGGTAVFDGTRVPVKNLFDYLETGETLDQFLLDFPAVNRAKAVAVLEMAQGALLDESLPRRLRGDFTGHAVETVTQCGWSGMENGELLQAAAGRFDVFPTADQNIEYQQNLSALPLAVVVLVARRTTYQALRPLMPEVLESLDRLEPRALARIGS